jgi:hypothetical protein
MVPYGTTEVYRTTLVYLGFVELAAGIVELLFKSQFALARIQELLPQALCADARRKEGR